MPPPDAQPRFSRRSWLRSSVVAPLAGGVLGAAACSDARRVPRSDRDRIRDRHFPNVALRTHDHRRVRFYDDLVKGKVVLINFMYANCDGVCPGITMNLAKVQTLLGARVGREVFMYSITLEPERDSPAVLNEYARAHGAARGWTFLTGRPADIERLRRALGFVDPDPETDRDRSNHIGNIRYGNEPAMLWAACPGLADPHWIVESLSWVVWPREA